MTSIILQLDAKTLYPHPAVELGERWHKSPQTIRRMCKAGEIPGAFLQNGEWFVRPLLLIGFDWESVESNTNGRKNNAEDSGQETPARPRNDGRDRREMVREVSTEGPIRRVRSAPR